MIKSCDEEILPLKEETENITFEIEPLLAKKGEIATEIKSYDHHIRDRQKELRDIDDELSQAQLQINQYNQRIRDIKEKESVNTQAQRDDLEKKIRVLNENIDKELEREKAFSSEFDRLEYEFKQHNDQLFKIDSDLHKAQDEQRSLVQSINNLNDQRNDKFLAYGANMPNIIREINALEQKRMWRGAKPIGPFGFIKLM